MPLKSKLPNINMVFHGLTSLQTMGRMNKDVVPWSFWTIVYRLYTDCTCNPYCQLFSQSPLSGDIATILYISNTDTKELSLHYFAWLHVFLLHHSMLQMLYIDHTSVYCQLFSLCLPSGSTPIMSYISIKDKKEPTLHHFAGLYVFLLYHGMTQYVKPQLIGR